MLEKSCFEENTRLNIMSLIGFSHAGRDERERGNKLFSEKKYDEAIGCYTAAIVSIRW